MIAVTGATGEVGRRVARAARPTRARLVVRDASRAPAAAPTCASRRATARFDEMRAALEGADTVFLIPAAESADRVEQHKTAVDAAVAAGVARIVYLSFFGAAPDATFTLARDHWATEQHIRAAGLAWTFLRMNLYMDFIPSMAVDGVIRGPAGDGRVAAILRDDVAAAAAAVLTRSGHDGQTYDLTGPSAFSLRRGRRADGRPLRRRDRRGGLRRRASTYGAPDWEVEGWVSSYQAIRDGSFDVVSTRRRATSPGARRRHLR